MPRRYVTVALATAMLVGGPPAHGQEVERTPPYDFEVAQRSLITLRASISNTGPQVPVAMSACFGLRTPEPSITFRGLGCTLLPDSGSATTVETSFESTVWANGFEPGPYMFLVHLRGQGLVSGPHEVRVDSISSLVAPT